MKGLTKKLIGATALAIGVLCLTVLCVTTTAEAKTYKKTCHVLVGTMRCLPDSDLMSLTKKSKVTVANKKILKYVKKVDSNFKLLNAYSDSATVSGVFVKGKKKGKTKVTVKVGKSKYVYTVTVHAKKQVKTDSGKALKKKLKELGKTTSDPYVFYADLSGDGIDDLFVDGTMYGYNYGKKIVEEVETGLIMDAVDAIYVSKKNRIIYFDTTTASKEIEAGNPVKIYTYELEDEEGASVEDAEETPDKAADGDANEAPGADAEDPTGEDSEDEAYDDEEEEEEEEGEGYAGFHRGLAVALKPGSIFESIGQVAIKKYNGFGEYDDSSQFNPEDEYFFFNDSSYDQDDLYYEPYTVETLAKKMKTILPDKKQVYVKKSSL